MQRGLAHIPIGIAPIDCETEGARLQRPGGLQKQVAMRIKGFLLGDAP